MKKLTDLLKEHFVEDRLWMHLKLVAEDLSTSLAKDWDAGIVSIEERAHTYHPNGRYEIVKQFPEKSKDES